MFNSYVRANSLPNIDSYAKAAAEWEKTKPIRGRGDTDTRPLGPLRAVDRFAVRRVVGESYALRYHSTDVVTYHPDGSITLDAWASRTTDQFANRLLPWGVQAWFECALGCAVILTQAGEDRLFLLGRNPTLRFDRKLSGYVLDNSEPVEVYGIDRKRSGAALRATRYADFMAWLKMKENLDPQRYQPGWSGAYRHEIVAWLEDVGRWPTLREISGIENRLRMAIYTEAGDVVTRDEIPYLTGPGRWRIYSEVRNVLARQSKYQYL